jgi:hypothetical protein
MSTAREDGPVEDNLLMGFAGHGTSSWALHYYFVQGPLALFLQLAWGGAFDDPEAAANRIEGCLELAEDLRLDIAEVKRAGRLPRDQRLVVVESDFTQSRSGWIPLSPAGAGTVEWQKDPPVLFLALMARSPGDRSRAMSARDRIESMITVFRRTYGRTWKKYVPTARDRSVCAA